MIELLSVNNLTYSARVKDLSGERTDKKILDNISLSINESEIVGIAGESGSGKTTLAKILSGIIKNYSGNIIWNLSNILKASPVQILFQNSNEILNPYRKVDAVIDEALNILGSENLSERKEKLLSLLNIPAKLLMRKGSQLSGGEQQRVALARILAVEPRIIIADEPFSSQDPGSQINVLKTLQKINKEKGIAIFCITHNLNMLREFADRVLIIYNGRIIEEGIANDVLHNPTENYTKFLLRSENYDLTYADFIDFRQQSNG